MAQGTTVTKDNSNDQKGESGWFNWFKKKPKVENDADKPTLVAGNEQAIVSAPELTHLSTSTNSNGQPILVPQPSASTSNVTNNVKDNNTKKRTNYHTVPGLYSKRKLSKKEARARLKLIKNYAKWLDAIPGLPISIGLDGIVGLIPGVGDLATGVLSLMLIYLARDFDLPTTVKMKLLTNVGFDTLVGTVPLFGDIFDIMFKANLKNVEILEKWLNKNIHLFSDDTEIEV